MIIEEGGTPIYQAIIASFNMELFGSMSAPVSNIIYSGDGESEDEMKEYRSRLKNSTDPFPNHANTNDASNKESTAEIPHPSSSPTIDSPDVLDVMDAITSTESEAEDRPITPEPKKRPAPRKKAQPVAIDSPATENLEVAVHSTRGGRKKAAKKTTTASQATGRNLRNRG